MPDIIPSIYRTEEMGGDPNYIYDGLRSSNYFLRTGEVKRIIAPVDPDSKTGTFYEYDVFASHRENNTIISKMYRNCLLFNPLGSGADKCVWKLRVDDTDSSTNGSKTKRGKGSKVLLLCIDAVHSDAIILGGIREDTDTDKGEDEGHHHTFVFNGTTIKVQDDGSYSIQVDGKTRADGQPHKNRAGGGGSSIKVEANGDILIATKDNKQAIIINNQEGTISVKGDKDIVVNGTKIHIGQGATEPGVLGNQLASLLSQTLSLIASMTAGLTDPMLAASSMAQATILSTTVSTVLSKTVTIKS
jgi:hypothetical protein